MESCRIFAHIRPPRRAPARHRPTAYDEERRRHPGCRASIEEDTMLANTEVMATVAVRDIAAARAFYGDTLGLQESSGGAAQGEVLSYLSGSSLLMVYRSEYAGTNAATSATWAVGDEIEEIVAALKGKGVAFEHYDMPGLHLAGDIHVGEAMKVAWFKDPDGNILSIVGT
jgi:catechol 2,3-dioxygenase-like lactoylglutathione lyase family enzyme